MEITVENSSVILNFVLNKNEKFKYYIRLKIYKFIILRF